MTDRAEQFLTSFNRIEKWMQEQLNNPVNMGFSEMTRRLAKTKKTQVNRYEDDLLQMAQLRNAIVHDKISPDFIIAEPNEWVLAKIKKVEKELVEPEQIISRFKKNVTGFEKDTSLHDILAIVAKKGYSQFPIYDKGKFIGLITVHGLGLWLAKESLTNKIEIHGKTAADVLQSDRKSTNYQFIAADTFVFQAIEIFQQYATVEALLITRDGNPNGSLLGIIRPRDIQHYQEF